MEFAPIPKVDLAGAVLGQIRDAILLGELAPGDTLPSERELAVQLGVNRTTVREVLSRLELLGLIDRQHGKRCQVRDYRRSGALNLIPELVRLRVDGVYESLIESTTIVYAGTVDLAVRRATRDDLAALRQAAGAVEDAAAAADRAAVVAADREFHLLVATVARSVTLELMASNFYRAIDGPLDTSGSARQRIADALIDRHGKGRILPHRRLAEAIAARDGVTARKVATAMIDGVPRGRRGR